MAGGADDSVPPSVGMDAVMNKITKRVFAGGAVAAVLAVAVAVVAVGMNPSHDVERLAPTDSREMVVSDLPQKDVETPAPAQGDSRSDGAAASAGSQETPAEAATPLPGSQGGSSASPSNPSSSSPTQQGGSQSADNVVDVSGSGSSGGLEGGSEDKPEQGGEDAGDEGAWTGYY